MAIVKARDTWGNNESNHNLADVFGKLTPSEKRLLGAAVAINLASEKDKHGYKRYGLEAPPAFILRK